MLGIILDMVVLGGLLSFFSEESWSDQKWKLFMIALGIAFLGGIASAAALPYVGLFALGVYFLVAAVVLWGFTEIGLKLSTVIAAVFVTYKILLAVAFLYLFTT